MIRTINGHLTATEKRHIDEMFKRNLTEARVNRKDYFIKNINGAYEVIIFQKDNSMVYDNQIKKHKAQFMIV